MRGTRAATLGGLLIATALWAAAPARAHEPEVASPSHHWVPFSDRPRAFRALRADPREARFRLGFLYENHGHVHEDLAWGADLGLLRGDLGPHEVITISGRGLVTARFDFMSESFDLLNIDFVGGVAIGYARDSWELELFAYHQSSHLGDEVAERGERRRADLGFERLRLLVAYRTGALRFYLGPAFTVHAWPAALELSSFAQGGVEFSFDVAGAGAYAALDVQARLDKPALEALTIQLGVDIAPKTWVHTRQRVFLEFFHGRSRMGQYWEDEESYVQLGVALDLLQG